jgi:Domain of unknown function (DUF4331)
LVHRSKDYSGMTQKQKSLFIGVALAAVALGLAGCGGGGAAAPAPVAVAPPPPPAPQTSFSLTKCLNQVVGGRKVVDIVVPDQLVLDLAQPSGFPNGRDLDDPVVDLELAVLFLDLTKHPADTLVKVPVNPNVFDQPLRATFPFFAAPLGTPPISATNGTTFNFRADAAANYVRVDRAGIPAVSTVTVLGPRKNAYNDSSPAADATSLSVPDILAGYQALTDALNDDFKGLGLTPCAT